MGPLHWEHGVLTTGPPGKSDPLSRIKTSCLEQKLTPGRRAPGPPLPGLRAGGSSAAGTGSPCGGRDAVLACCPWPGQPLLGPGLITQFSCPVLVNSPWMGPDLAGSFAETSGACLCPNSVTQLCSGLQLLGTCWVWLTPVPTPCSWFSGAWFPNVSGTACQTVS